MAKTILGNSGPQFNWTGSGAKAWVPFDFGAVQQFATSEADLQHRMGHAGTFGDLTARVGQFTRGTNSHVKLRKNGADTAADLIINGTGNFSDHVNTATVAVDDLVALVYENGSGGGNFEVESAALTFEADNGALVSIFGAAGSGNFSAGLLALNGSGLTRYVSPFVGFGNQGNSLTDGQMEIPTVGGTISYLQMNVQSNTRTGAVTVTLMKNGVATALTFVIGAGVTGKVGDFTHSVTFAAGDLLNLRLEMASSSGTANIVRASCEVEWDSSTQFIVHCANKINGFDAWGADSYASVIGGGMADNNTVGFRQTVWPIDCDLVEFICYSDTTNGDITTTLNLNGSDTALTVTRPGGAVGSNRLDVTATVSVTAGDVLAYHHVRAGSSTNGFGSAHLVVEIAATGNNVTPDAQDLELEGLEPTIELIYPPIILSPNPQTLELEGLTPLYTLPIDYTVGEPQVLEIEGLAPSIAADTLTFSPDPQDLEIVGYAPALVEQKNVSQLPVMALGRGAPSAAASQLPVMIGATISPDASVSQMALLSLAEIVPPVAASQAAILILAGDAPCLTRRCQLWRITRTDGEVFRYTSLDRDFLWGTETFKACASLQPSASESESTLDAAGSIELEGLIDDEGITAEDLYSGKFDDAYVEVWLVPYEGPTDYTRRLAAGWTGTLSMGDATFRMEVLGPSSKLKQTSLVETYTAACRFEFGDQRCGFDRETTKVAGSVLEASTRAEFIVQLAAEDTSTTWENGKLVWLTGANAGQTVEIKSLDLSSGLLSLWVTCWFVPQPGDTFSAYPGCDHTFDGGCTLYANTLRYGGFKDIPGNDALQETPVAKY